MFIFYFRPPSALHIFVSHLHKIVAPVVESFTFPKNLTRGKRLRTVCTVTEGDLPIEIEWKRDGITLLSDASPTGPKVRRIDEYTSLLAIASLETGDAGNYSCVASNAVAEIARSAVLTIRGKLGALQWNR